MKLFACAPSASPSFSGLITLAGTVVYQGAVCDQPVVSKLTTSGANVQIAVTTHTQILSPPSGQLLFALTLSFPPSPQDGQRIQIATTQAITLLSCTAATVITISNAPTTLAAVAGMEYCFVLAPRRGSGSASKLAS